MTGFIRGLFGGKKRPPAPKNTGAFFLSEDDAKTFGDIDYMRSNKVVKRTFARKKGQTEEMESVRQISALSKKDVDEKGLARPDEKKTSVTFEQARSFSSSESKFQRRQTDSNMDMFRNMAKDIKKR